MSARGGALLGILTSGVAVVTLFWRLQTVPPIGYDEWWFLSRFERQIAYGDTSDVVGFDQFAGNGQHSKLPPLLFPLRFGIHALLGRGAGISRAINALELCTLGALLGWLAWRQGAPLSLALLGPAFLLSFPTTFAFARAVRYEQDTFFFGTLSLLVPGLFPRRSLAWAASGALAGAAASMHPMGCIFAITFAIAALLEWRRGRGATLRPVALRWLAGFLLPLLVTGAYYAVDWQNTLVYFRGTQLFHQGHHPYRLRSLRALAPVPAWVPDQTAAVLNAIRHGLKAPSGSQMADLSFALWALAIAAMSAVSAGLVSRAVLSPDRRASGLPRPTLCAAAVLAAAIVTFSYPANTDYVLYLAGLCCMAAYVVGAGQAAVASPGGAAVIHAAMFLITVIDLGAVWPGGPDGPSAAQQIAAMRDTASRLGVGRTGAPLYADTASWAGAGRRLAPLHEYLILEVAPARAAYEGVVFSTSWYGAFVPQIAPFTGRPVDPERRRGLMAALTRDLAFAGALVSVDGAGNTLDTRLWLLRHAPAEPLFVSVGPAGERRERGEPLPPDEFEVEGSFNATRTFRAPPGRYAVLLTGSALVDSWLSVSEAGRVFAGSRLHEFPHQAGGALVLFEVSKGEVDVQAEGRALAPGFGRLLYWHVAPASSESVGAAARLGPTQRPW